ncbi:hypothetical protein CFP65_0058 [Kitasatospora sp. MMS16-BH015]|uniref:hypothetical protein n=1 Tax=Kitasatospora sp. MMS16-BH015 TaxID=2018025 RepID=UPI000CA308D5|nr:hypothetical protein [Kitasatospora sp. MMS16-BH015]AUG75044.1 hypothetical protein CFP65_0058 [Kitasatospora sp. MMS16-BH015]
MAYRYWCGECGFKTPWLTEPQGRQAQIDHYTRNHPDTPPGGDVERGHRPSTAAAFTCAGLIGAAVLLVLLAAACHP